MTRKRGYFITGTDTGVGKTRISCLIARALKAGGVGVGVMKPVETGCLLKDGRLEPSDALALKEASGSEDDLDLINPYRFSVPLAPNIASRLEGVPIDLEKIKSSFLALKERHEVVLVEGAGGLLAPVTDGLTMAGLTLLLELSVIIIAASRLGVINHACLTVECARARGLTVKGIILNNVTPPEGDASRPYNRGEIERLTGVPMLGEVPFHEKFTPDLLELLETDGI